MALEASEHQSELRRNRLRTRAGPWQSQDAQLSGTAANSNSGSYQSVFISPPFFCIYTTNLTFKGLEAHRGRGRKTQQCSEKQCRISFLKKKRMKNTCLQLQMKYLQLRSKRTPFLSLISQILCVSSHLRSTKWICEPPPLYNTNLHVWEFENHHWEQKDHHKSPTDRRRERPGLGSRRRKTSGGS